MAISTYDMGDEVRCTSTFTTASGGPVDPTTITFKIKDPSDNTTTYIYGTDTEVIKSSVGIYYMDVDADEAGTWWFRCESTGVAKATEEDCFFVDASQV